MSDSDKNSSGTPEILNVDRFYEAYQALSSKTVSGRNTVILDVRTAEEYESGHVPGSKNIPHTELPRSLDQLNPDAEIYVYCRSGGRVQFAHQILAQAGFSKLHLITSGGMPDWIAKGYPTEK